ADDPPVVHAQDDVDPVAPEPRSFVEAVLRTGRSAQLSESIEHGALRRRPPALKLHQNRLAWTEICEPQDQPGLTHVESAAPGGARGDDGRSARGADARRECAAVDRIEAGTSPPPADERNRDCEENDPAYSSEHNGNGSEPCRKHQGKARLEPNGRRCCKAEAKRPGEELWQPPDHERVHGATRPWSCASRAGPMPGIASSSSTEPKAPCCSR